MATARVVTAQPEMPVDAKPPSRCEFLYYVWGVTIFLLILGLVAGLLWFTLPSSITNPDWIITINLEDIPSIGSPVSFPRWHLYLSRTHDDALVALYADVPDLGCSVRWIPLNQRFEEPCYGFKFRLDGTHIEGMVHPRDLDRYPITITFADGSQVTTNEAGDPIPLNGREIASITVNTYRLIVGMGRV